MLSEPLYTALFPEGHPYHDLPIGTEASLAGLTLDKARAYAGRWYTPSNVTVHVSGDLRGEEFIELFPQTFPKGLLVHPDSGAVTKECGTKRADPVALPDVDPPELIRMKGAVRNPVGMIAWSFPPDKWTFASFDLAIAENAMSRALDRGVSCWTDGGRHAGAAFCRVPLAADEDPVKVMKKGIRATSDAWEPNVRDALADSYDWWRAASKVDIYRQLDRRGSEVVAVHFHNNGRQDWLNAWFASLSVTDFSEAALFGQRWLLAKRAHFAVVEPSDDEPAALPTFHGDRADQSFASLDPSTVDVAFLDRIIGEPRWAAAKQEVLPNGLVVTVLPYGQHDVVRVDLTFPGAGVAEPSPGLDVLTWNTLPNPTRDEHLRALALVGAMWDDRSSDHWSYRIDGTDLGKQLELLRSHVDAQVPAGLPKDAIERIQKTTATIEGRERRARENTMLGEHAVTPEKLAQSVALLKAKDLKAWAKTQLSPQGAHLVIVGNVDPARAIALAKGSFGTMKGTGERGERRFVEVPPPPRSILVLEDEVTRTQASVRLACRLEGEVAAGHITASLVSTAAEDVLRRSKGLTYGVQGSVGSDVGGLRLDLVTQVQREGVVDAVNSLREVVAALASEGPDDAALAAARLQEAGYLADSLQDSEDLVGFMGAYARAGNTPADMDGFGELLMGIDREAVKKALGSCTEHEVISILGTGVADVLTAGGLQHHVVK
ncbi:MAG: insulinase family protein [Alphaproteobacteria bacterium]|nr:insulinase family protein [Alphaproteobacteria bacterium]